MFSKYRSCAKKLSNYFDKFLLYIAFPFTPLLGSDWAILKTIYDKVYYTFLVLVEGKARNKHRPVNESKSNYTQ